MKRIFIVEKYDNPVYLKALKEYLKDYTAEENIISNYKSLCENETGDIIIFKSLPYDLDLSKLYIENGVVILDPQKADGLDILKRTKGIAVDCGFMTKATVTPSSIDEEQISVCIQRNIITPFIEIGEQEVIIKRMEGLTVYEHMSLVIAKLLLSKG